MTDHYPAEIHIGGPIPRTVLDELVKQIVAAGASLEGYGERTVTDKSVREALREDHIVDLFDDRACCGRFDELEDFLIRHQIHFNRHCEAYCEYDAENVYFRGGERALSMPAAQEGDDLIRCKNVMDALNNDGLDDRGKLEALAGLVTPPETEPLELIRFV